jgi:tetratricopeptide (TPR) repeat protein
LGLYWPVIHDGFVSLDDHQYITDNAMVRAGLTWPGVIWAFTNTEAANWHPVTWLSHMVDCQFFGLHPGAHHLVNVGFHIANTLLLFTFLCRTTGALWRSAFVAALFAWHPLRVESVAWAAERKDVLCAFFWLLTLLAYARYAARIKDKLSGAWKHYTLALVFFALALLSKPMAVTLPFVLILLDVWPLNRLPLPPLKASLKPLLLEKLPFLALSLAASAITYFAQKNGGAIWVQSSSQPSAHVTNLFVAYASYLEKIFWPTNLAVIYPFRDRWPTAVAAGAFLIIMAISLVTVWRFRPQPYLFAGWFWFLGTLVPVIGVVQFGAQFIADRYTYLPAIGLMAGLVWAAVDAIKWPAGQKLLTVAVAAVLAACCLATTRQLNYWRDSETLFRHTLAVTEGNYTAANFLGLVLAAEGRKSEATPYYEESVRIAPRYPEAQFNLGMALLDGGDASAAVAHLTAATQLLPTAIGARFFLARALAMDGKKAESADQFQKVLAQDPNNVYALNELAWLRSTCQQDDLRDGKTAIKLAQHACELTQGRQPRFLLTLAAAYAETGNYHDATVIAGGARKLALDSSQNDIANIADTLLKYFTTNQPFREKS